MSLPPVNHEKRGRDNRLRSPQHLAFIRKRLCIAWERKECEGKVEAAHCRDIAPHGHGGGKPDDLWACGMCRRHHRESEKRETEWGIEMGLDVRALCLEYALASPDRRIKEAARAIINA
jgi:hypothetical protein